MQIIKSKRYVSNKIDSNCCRWYRSFSFRLNNFKCCGWDQWTVHKRRLVHCSASKTKMRAQWKQFSKGKNIAYVWVCTLMQPRLCAHHKIGEGVSPFHFYANQYLRSSHGKKVLSNLNSTLKPAQKILILCSIHLSFCIPNRSAG